MIDNLQELLTPSLRLCWRVVETQEKAATRDITNSADEQSRLEELLDEVKPPVPSDCEGLSYLLKTPFRYPPLKYGSRFGSPFERGIYYASIELQTAFAESAVYFWLFQAGPVDLGPLEQIKDHRTAISVRLSSQLSVQLESDALKPYHKKLSDPSSWTFTQSLGLSLRELGVEFISYPSARFDGGANIAVFSPSCFATGEPEQQQLWNVRLTREDCWFGKPDGTSYEYYRADFEEGGKIPHPAL